VKFTRKGGRITARLAVAGNLVRVEVEDDGLGIAPEALAHIFESTRNEATGLERAEGGAFVGLALVKGIVELHGGTVEARSAGLDKGATFACLFQSSPWNGSEGEGVGLRSRGNPQALHTIAAVTPSETNSLRGKRLLVVEDAVDTAQTLAEVFEALGAKVDIAGSVAAAQSAIDAHIYDLLVCDLGLPDGNGLPFLRSLKSSANLNARAPAIALTAHVDDDAARACREAGFEVHMGKPFEVVRLAAVATRLVEDASRLGGALRAGRGPTRDPRDTP
jgi:CheY-like chemotaxis protein